MSWNASVRLPSALMRFTEEELPLLNAEDVEIELETSSAQFRTFAFTPDHELLPLLSVDYRPEDRQLFIPLRNRIIEEATSLVPSAKRRFYNQGRIASRLLAGLHLIHLALRQLRHQQLVNRRFVLIKERPVNPTIYHLSPETSILAYVGPGPAAQEHPSIYLGLNLIDVVLTGLENEDANHFEALLEILRVEERAIETGYTHTEALSAEQQEKLNGILDRTIELAAVFQSRSAPLAGTAKPFRPNDRERLLEMLDARLPGESGLFDFNTCRKALEELEKLARRYKTQNDSDSLNEVIRLLVAASGHDIHELRNRANIALERTFSPKSFDAPLATEFETINIGTRYQFSFDLPKNRSGYLLRIYGDRSPGRDFVTGEFNYIDIDLAENSETGRFEGQRLFNKLGNFDWLLFRRTKSGERWLDGYSGRLNVLPDLDGEIVLEIFPDIHGHTRLYWRTPNPGMVYNESGQIIRTGTFADIAAHLADIKERYSISAVYVLGAQKRGSNREDWAPEAQSPSPFAPMSMTELEPALGGEEEFRQLVAEAHRLDIRVILDVIPHLNRQSGELPDEYAVRCYDESGNLQVRGSTDGRYGSWNDGKLLNYRKFAVWEWLADSVCALIERYDIDGIRFDSAHAVPVMMRRNNYPFIHGEYRSRESVVEGDIIDNTREHDHLVTTGYYDSACAEMIAVPFHYYLSLRVHRLLRRLGKRYFVNLAECYWGREQYLTRTGTVPYNSALFKICENIVHGKTDVREIYHIYHNYFPSILPKGAHLLGILGNHDERRALNTFGPRGLKAAAMLTSFLSSIILDYEGSAEGESWKVYLDNIYVNWNDFEREAYRGTVDFYRELYREHRKRQGRAYLIWADNPMVAAALRFSGPDGIVGAFNFADRDQHISFRFDDARLPIEDDAVYQISDPVYSAVTGDSGWYTGAELRKSRIATLIPHTDRYKLLTLRRAESQKELRRIYPEMLQQSLYRLCSAPAGDYFQANYAFREIKAHMESPAGFIGFLKDSLLPLLGDNREALQLSLKRSLFHLCRGDNALPKEAVWQLIRALAGERDEELRALGEALQFGFRGGSVVFLSAEADPFSKSGGLANVVYELPRELALLGEEAVVITPYYRRGEEKAVRKMQQAYERYGMEYTGRTVRFWVEQQEYEVGVHSGMVDGIRYYLLDHHEFFDGLYFGVTGAERLRRRAAFSRASAEVIRSFELDPLAIFTNDAFAGVFSSIVRGDPGYAAQAPFNRASLIHIIHNGGWQYFDAYHRFERGQDIYSVLNLPLHESWRFEDPSDGAKLNCMAAGILSADKIVTVSPSYAEQIQLAADGMERILHDVVGINNGVGTDFRHRALLKLEQEEFIHRLQNPLAARIKGDTLLARQLERAYPELLEPGALDKLRRSRRKRILERMRLKLMLQLDRGLEVDPEAPLFVMIHRLTEQKGFQLLLEASHGIFSTLGYQGIIGGAVAGGDERGEELARGLLKLPEYFPGQAAVGIGFQDVRIPLLAADLFLMPSLHEPGGISQLEAFACGCFVCARATGGLRDTVHSLVRRGGRLQGNGVLFSDYTATAFYDAMQRFHRLFSDESLQDLAAARDAMIEQVYSWRRPAERYRDLIYTMKEIVPQGKVE